jgi:hypothetical protein
MPSIAIAFGAVLCALGAWGYIGADADSKSVTALIPAFVGIPLIVCGVLAYNPAFRKHAMHVAAAIGLLGFIAGMGRGIMKLGAAISDDPTLHRAPRTALLMGLICLAFVAACVWSFIAARRRRIAATGD